jgi:hypothetical protein
MEPLRKRKYLALFLTLVVMLGLQPLAHGYLAGLILFDILGSIVLVIVFLIIFEGRLQRGIALLGMTTAVACNWAAHVLRGDPRDQVLLAYHALATLFLGTGVVLILRGIFEKKTIQSDDVIGGLCGYLLAGAVWSNLYQLIEGLVPGSFAVAPAIAWQMAQPNPRRFLFNFFSFVTISSLGTNQLSPVSPLASWLVCLESIFGQFYVAVVVAQMVGLKLAQGTRHHEMTEPQSLALKNAGQSSLPKE